MREGRGDFAHDKDERALLALSPKDIAAGRSRWKSREASLPPKG
jgi:hypothetical protein